MFYFNILGMLFCVIGLVNYSFAEASAVDTPEVSALKANIVNLGKNIKNGKYFPETQIPVELNAIRVDMLKIANLGRQNPKYRVNNKEANDLSGESVVTQNGEEKIFKNSVTPPYFNDLVLNDALNKAAQFQAEWQAKIQDVTHQGPKEFNGKPTTHAWQRTIAFDFDNDKYQLEGEGGAAAQSVDVFPENWMKSETHYRPWFNIGHDVRQIGLGLAKGANGIWYATVIAAEGERKW